MKKAIYPFVSKSNSKEIDTKEVDRIAELLDLHKKVVELLFQKDITDVESIKKYLYPSKENLFDPFLMKNMGKVVERIQQAIDSGERIVIFGDYDCDGICAAAILWLYLTKLGVDANCYIPKRETDGYGLNNEAIEKILEEFSPDLIITCDCGISCIEEVAYTLDLGVDILITDHHEAGEIVPDCLILNPKQSECSYPCTQLCGAGVVLKLIQALGGIEAASDYFGLAALATVADLVPLEGENRLIAQLGLSQGQLGKNLGMKMLIKSLGMDSVLASDIAFKIAPRINAAGRMGDAFRAFQLVTSNDPEQIKAIITEIETDNDLRKELCNKLYDEAIGMICKEDLVSNRALVISHPEWEKGITGIVAARLCGEFCRPTFILVRSGDFYKGTVRSVSDVNIYELLTSVKELLIEFGGHSQAAGFSIYQENIPEFKRRVNEYLREYPSVSFITKVKYDVDIDIDDITVELVNEINLLEPFGNGNCRPLFRLLCQNLKINNLKNSEHISINVEDKISAFAFSYRRQAHLFMGNDTKELILDFRLNVFKNRTKVDAYVKACLPTHHYIDDNAAKANFIKYINYKEGSDISFSYYSNEELSDLIGTNIFGTLIIVGCKRSYDRLLSSKNSENIVVHEMTYAATKNNYSRVIASPEFDEYLLLTGYDRIIFLDSLLNYGIISYINKKTSAKVYVPSEENYEDILGGIDLSRETFARYYNLIKDNQRITMEDMQSYCQLCGNSMSDFDLRQFVVCLSVFVDLDIVKVSRKNFNITINRNAKVNLSDSKNYLCIKRRLEEIEARVFK